MRFVLLRHATTEWNLLGKIQGHTDTELAAQGRKEARALAEQIAGLRVHAVVSSDLQRATRTARIIARRLKIPDERFEVTAGLRECAFGSIEGLTRAEAGARHGASVEEMFDDLLSYDFRPFGGECAAAVLQRHLRTLRVYSARYRDMCIALVGHGRGLNTLLEYLGHAPTLERNEYRIIDHEPVMLAHAAR
ncbi:histidine phosphatase family protein [Candidatus Uhrbacteria bacterium]|nr:histidine phosphatase family protein [Candidatus Uhrbacteria bacterium]